MTESKADAFNVFSACINTAHDFNVRLLGYALLAVTKPKFNQRLRDQFCFEMRSAEPTHGLPLSLVKILIEPENAGTP
jgi:hypothetical protein